MKFVEAKSTDGIFYKGLISEPENPKGIIIHIHGMSGNPIINEFYKDMHLRYPKSGWSFLAIQHRGSESVTQFNSYKGILNIGNTFEIFEDCVHDIQGWINFAKEKGYKKIWLQAHSLGSSKVAYFINQTKSRDVDGLILISPADMLGLVHDDIGKKDHERLLPEALDFIKSNRPEQTLSYKLWDDLILSAKTYISLFGDKAKDAIFNYFNPELGWSVVNSIEIPVLAISGTKDDAMTIKPYDAMKMLEKELKKSPKKKTIVYQNADHSFDGFGQQIVSDVLKFINLEPNTQHLKPKT